MIEEILNIQFSPAGSSIIKVLGVGGAGCNAVNHMYNEGIAGVDFLICNTDAQALQVSPVPVKIQLGVTLTEGRGAGNMPGRGEQAAVENLDDVRAVLQGSTKMLFITAGMGGGTGTGAAPVIARLARELEILTIAVVTVPSPAEGKKRFDQALEGVEKLGEYVDSMLVISNEKLQKTYGNLPASIAFKKADDVIGTAVKGVAEIITLHGNINIDFADVYTVMSGSKVFLMGTGIARGEGRAMRAVHAALESPLLDSNDIFGSKDILLNLISGTDEITMDEVGEIIDFLQEKTGQEANIIWGNGVDPKLGSQVSVTLIATRFDKNPNRLLQPEPEVQQFVLDHTVEHAHSENNGLRELFSFDHTEEKPEEKKPEEVKITSGWTVRRKKKARKPVTEPEENGNTENWFLRQFNRLFEDEDDNMDER